MLSNIKKEIEKANNIVISGHINPDGDCIGAGIALKLMIEQFDKNKNVIFLIEDEIPNYIKEMPFVEIKNKLEENQNIDLLISVDVANIDRLAVSKDVIPRAKKTINIDHHISNSNYFDINYVKDISSASELIYELINVLNIKLTKEIASYIYLGIINDTGNFRHKNVRSSTFLIASKLIETGIDINHIYFALFSKTLKKAEIFSKSIINGIYDENKKFISYYLSQDDIIKNNYTISDMDGVSEYMLTIKGIELAVFMRELENGEIKGSFRSKVLDVNEIAGLLNGGGHKLAAGFKTDKKYNEIMEIICKNI